MLNTMFAYAITLGIFGVVRYAFWPVCPLSGFGKSEYSYTAFQSSVVPQVGIMIVIIVPYGVKYLTLGILRLSIRHLSETMPSFICPSQAAATKMKRLMKSVLEDIPEGSHVSAALKSAANTKNMGNAERDLLKLFKSLDMSVDVPIDLHQFGFRFVAHVKLRSWLKFLLTYKSELLLGGFHRRQAEAELALGAFWSNFRAVFGQHEVFRTHADRLPQCVPYYLFFDEGVGLRKSAVLVISMQCVLGTGTAEKFLEAVSLAQSSNEDCRVDTKLLMTQSQQHNSKGSTYNTRFLYSVLPKKFYRKNELLPKLLAQIAKDAIDVMQAGIQVRSETLYGICLGVKADAPMHSKLRNLTRSFAHMGQGHGVCYECCAGQPAFPFEDCRAAPKWEASIYTARPFRNLSPLLSIPGIPGVPEWLLKRDPFHTFKQNIGCHLIASSIVLIGELGYWPGLSSNVDALLARAHEDFSHWCQYTWAGKSVAFLKAFTKEQLHFPKKDAYPSARFKGSDTMLLARWLLFAVRNGFFADDPFERGQSPLKAPLEAWHRPIFLEIEKGCKAGVQYFHLMHRSGVWLSRDVAREMGHCALLFVQAFSHLAKLCHERSMPRYHIVPSLHAMCHFYMDMKKALAIRPMSHFLLSPAVTNCEQDEDFVGKIARLTRKVHARTTTERTLQRYLVKLHCEWNHIR